MPFPNELADSISGGVVMGALVHKFKHVHFQLMTAVAMQTLFLALSALDTPRTTAQTLAFHFLATVPFAWVTVACYVTASLHSKYNFAPTQIVEEDLVDSSP